VGLGYGKGAATALCARHGAAAVLAFAGCTPSVSNAVRPIERSALQGVNAAGVREFVRIEEEALAWLSAADPRLAARTNAAVPDAVLEAIGTEAVLAEDASAQILGRSLDLFAFRARAHALHEAAKAVASFRETLPDVGASGSPLARPALERDLLVRLIAEEQQRAIDEAQLGDAAGDLVRAILSTWAPPAAPQEWADRDAWVSMHLLEIRDAVRAAPLHDGPFDLDTSLYPLERLLVPLEFPRGSAAIAQLRIAMDQDARAIAPLATPLRVARLARAHLGVDVDPGALRAEFEGTEARLRVRADQALVAGGGDRAAIEARARELLFIERPCAPVPGTRVRSMAPPPERAAICGAISALAEEAQAAAALVALHDDVLLALSAVTTSPPPRTRLLSKPPDDRVDDLRRDASERPIVAIGLALAAGLVYGADDPTLRLQTWRALAEAPLDVVERELNRLER
jgi:hypothetical protein